MYIIDFHKKSILSSRRKICTKAWQDYVRLNRLEITCGEAPYLSSRYDTVSGEIIPVKDRIGFLDRKLRIVSENVDSEKKWYSWAKKAVQSKYGFDGTSFASVLARKSPFGYSNIMTAVKIDFHILVVLCFPSFLCILYIYSFDIQRYLQLCFAFLSAVQLSLKKCIKERMFLAI